MKNILIHAFLIVFLIALSGCDNKPKHRENKPVITNYYKGCKDILSNVENENSKFVKDMLTTNISLKVETTKSLGFTINKVPNYETICSLVVMKYSPHEHTFLLMNNFEQLYILERNGYTVEDYLRRMREALSKAKNGE